MRERGNASHKTIYFPKTLKCNKSFQHNAVHILLTTWEKIHWRQDIPSAHGKGNGKRATFKINAKITTLEKNK